MYTRSAVYYDAVYSFKNYKEEVEKLDRLILQHKRSAGKSLLDVACGTGEHITYLRNYYQVEGLDKSPEMLRIARKKHPGITFHLGDMVNFDLKLQFDVIVCLFSSVGYMKTRRNLRRAVGTMARLLKAGGVIVVEPWFAPEAWKAGTLHANFSDQPELKVARISLSTVKGRTSIMNLYYLVGSPKGIDRFTERQEMGLFRQEEYTEAFGASGLGVVFDSEGLTGRGLYIATKAL